MIGLELKNREGTEGLKEQFTDINWVLEENLSMLTAAKTQKSRI